MGKVPPKTRKIVETSAVAVVEVVSKPDFGRKRTKIVIEAILIEIQGGLNPERACLLHGISTGSWRNWRACTNLSEARFDEHGMELTKDDRRCWDCSGCVLQARADKARRRYIKTHHKAIAEAVLEDGTPDWRARAFLLERTVPEEYGNKVTQELNHSLNAGTDNAQKLVGAIIGAAASKP